MKKRYAFILIEPLVVISIIADFTGAGIISNWDFSVITAILAYV